MVKEAPGGDASDAPPAHDMKRTEHERMSVAGKCVRVHEAALTDRFSCRGIDTSRNFILPSAG